MIGDRSTPDSGKNLPEFLTFFFKMIQFSMPRLKDYLSFLGIKQKHFCISCDIHENIFRKKINNAYGCKFSDGELIRIEYELQQILQKKGFTLEEFIKMFE